MIKYDNLWEILGKTQLPTSENRGQNMNQNQQNKQYENLDFVRKSRERLDVLIMAVNAAGPIWDDSKWSEL